MMSMRHTVYTMPQFIIEGPATLRGTIPVFGSKNAALPLLAAALLTDEPVTVANVPEILDVQRFITIVEGLGAEVAYQDHTLRVTAAKVTGEHVPDELVGKLRGSILLLGALLGRERQVSLPKPGGDIIGARPIDVHVDGFTQLGAVITDDDSRVTIDGQNMRAGKVVLSEFSVTATENMILAAVTLPGTTTIEIAAAEPHIVALAGLLNAMGADIQGAGTHRIVITGVAKLAGAEFVNIPDMLEAGFFLLLGAATKSDVEVSGVPMDDLLLFFKKFDDIGIGYDVAWQGGDTRIANVTLKPSRLKSFSIQTLPHPGIATDLQAPFSVIATQVTGSSLIHDPMYEGRFKYVTELQKMGAQVVVCDPHRVIITGPTPLQGRRIPSLDIRAGATLLMAGLVASGTTVIDQAEIIDRGYAQLVERLQALGAVIKREG